MRSRRSAIAAVGACVVLAGCSAPVDGAPSVRVVDAVKRSASLPTEQALPTLDELAVTLGIGGFLGQLVKGDADMLLQSVGQSEATPIDCVSTTYRLQKVVYQACLGARRGQPIVGRRRCQWPVDVRVLRCGQVRDTR